jgi:streptomycin 6-kinase
VPFQGLHDVARRRALASGEKAWLDSLPALVESLEREWAIVVGRPFTNGTEGYVAEASARDGGASGVLKLAPPTDATRHEITALELARGEGCAALLRADGARGAILLERLGPPLCDLGLSALQRHEILCDTIARLWRPAAGHGLPTGAWKGRWLVDYIERTWEELGRPCSERAVEHALACARRRIAAHDDERAVLVHGDVHQWNTLRAGDGFKLVDPDGLLAEAEYDLAIIMREDPEELLADVLAGDPRARSRMLAARSGLDETATWEWGVIERLSSALMCTQLEIQPFGRQCLDLAERISAASG